MLEIKIPEMKEGWDESTNEFIHQKEQILRLEHSLVSLSKWEQKWKKPFLTNETKTTEETIDYIRCMTLTQNVDPIIYKRLTNEHFKIIHQYINDPMTATTFSDSNKNRGNRLNGEQITAEIVYYWMIALNIPHEYRKWHLNTLLTLIRVCNIKNAPPKKMGRGETLRRNAALNAARRSRYNTKG